MISQRKPPLPSRPLAAQKQRKHPHGKSLSQNKNTYGYVIVTALLVCILFGLLFFKAPAENEHEVSVSREKPVQPHGPPTIEQLCQPKPRLCSHDLHGAELDVRTGSTEALVALWKAGIRCFSISVTPLRDVLVARDTGRVSRIMYDIRGGGPPTAQLPTHAELLHVANQQSLLLEEDFPTAEALLGQFRQLVKGGGHLVQVDSKPMQRWLGKSDKVLPMDTSLPMMLFHIEGSATRAAHYSHLASLVSQRELAHHVGIIVPELSPDHRAFTRAVARGAAGIHRGLSLPAAGPTAPVTVLDSAMIDFFAPHIKAPEAALRAVERSGKASVAFGVDTKEQLDKCTAKGMSLAVSPTAVAFKDAMQVQVDACIRQHASSRHHQVYGSGATHFGSTTQLREEIFTEAGRLVGDQRAGGSRAEGAAGGQARQITTGAGNSAEAESAQAGGAGEHDMERKAMATKQQMIQVEKAGAAAVGVASGGLGLRGGDDAVGASTVSIGASDAAAGHRHIEGVAGDNRAALGVEQEATVAGGVIAAAAKAVGMLRMADAGVVNIDDVTDKALGVVTSQVAGGVDGDAGGGVSEEETGEPTHHLVPADSADSTGADEASGGSDDADAIAGKAAPVLRARPVGSARTGTQ